MSEMDKFKLATMEKGYDLAEELGGAFILAFTQVYKAGIEKGMEIAAQTAPPAA